MSVAGTLNQSLRHDRAVSSRLVWAFVISMVLHLIIFGGYETGKKLNWWQNAHWPAWLTPIKRLVEAMKKPIPLQPALAPQPTEAPLVFVDVDPANASLEPPKKATHYSSLNTEAANPDINKESDLPKINGEQKHVVKTEDSPRNKPVPLQPAPPPPAPQEPEHKEEPKPKPAEPIGDLAMAKPEPKTTENKEPAQTPHTRPRTVREALARLPDNQLAGLKMKQEGGVRRKLQTSLFDTEASPLGAYDRALIDAIQNRWYSLLDERNYTAENRGKVILQFVLHPDGRVTDMTMSENSAGEVLGYLCEKAVQDPAPFPPWPMELRRMLGETRQIQFTFYYDIY